MNWDLIIVGGGTTGLTAATFAGQRGLKVLIVEAAPQLGGSLLVAHGQVSAAGTKLQAEKGIVDSAEAHYAEALKISKGTIDHDLARLAIFNAGKTFDWLMDNGYEVLPQCPALSSAHEPYSVPRYYWSADLGRGLARVLLKTVDQQIARGNVSVLLNTRVSALTQRPDGTVTGVTIEESAGVKRDIAARSVLLSSGGYAANPEMFERMVGVPLYVRAAYEHCKGAGLELGVAAGGYLRGREKYLSNFGWLLEDDRFPSAIIGRVNTYPNERPPWEIYVNAHAQRFIREDEPSVDVREHVLRDQPELRYWVIFDREIFERAPPMVYNWDRAQIESAFDQKFPFRSAATLAELAGKIGLDADALQRTVADYNAGRAAGRDAFGREFMPAPIERGPFYAIRQQGGSVTSTVGLAVDERLRVVRADGSVVPNLYAAGEILGSGQLQGNAFVGGMMGMPALVFGRLLGEQFVPGPEAPWRGASVIAGGKGYVDGDFGQVHYRSVGLATRTPFLLLHQAPFGFTQFVDVQTELVQLGRRSIALDNPGYGFSDPPPTDCGLAAIADHLASACNRLGLPPLLIAAHHTGAALACVLAVRHPQRVRGLVLHGVPLYDADERRERASRPLSPPVLEKTGDHFSKTFAAIGRHAELDEQTLGSATWATIGSFLAIAPSPLYRAVFAHDLAPDLRAITVPTLLLTDAADVLHANTRRAAELRPDFEFREFSARGSFEMMREPRRWAEVVADFADRHHL